MPAEELAESNRNVVGLIEVIASFLRLRFLPEFNAFSSDIY